jgi:uncharacterized HAD superfamily protein
VNIHKKHIPVQSLGFDIDCVVADTMEAFIRLAKQEYNITVLPEQITCFNVEECLAIDKTIVDNIFHKLMIDPIGHHLQLLPGARSVLQKIQQQAPLTFITARPDKKPVADWLTHELGSQTTSDMRIIAMGDHDGKTQHILNHDISHFIDDRYETCNDLQTKGITAIVFDQPWNHGQHTMPVVRSWQDIHNCCFNSLNL